MGSLTVGTAVVNEDIGKSQMVIAPLNFVGTYATSGDTLAASAVGGGRVKKIKHVSVDGSGGYVYTWDQAAGKLLAFESGADGTPNDEVGNGTDLTAEAPIATIYLGG